MTLSLAQGWPIVVACALGLGCSSDDAGPPERSLGLPAAPEELAPLARQLARVCELDYAGDATLAVFDPNQAGPHPMLFIAVDGSAHALNNAVPAAWRPRSVADVQLVVCAGDVTAETVETCEYSGTGSHTVYRKERSISLRMVSPFSGAATGMGARGGYADPCPFSLNSKIGDILGSLPSVDTIKERVIDRYALVPTCGASRPYASCLQCWLDEAEATVTGCGYVSASQERLPPARPGDAISLEWTWEYAPDALYLTAYGYRWSASEAGVLEQLEGEQVTARPTAPGAYQFLAEATLPATDGLTVQRRNYSLEVLAEPSITSVTGEGGPATVRAGTPAVFRATIQPPPPQSGYPGEELRLAWVDKPATSLAAEPVAVFGAHNEWGFDPDVAGQYRVQLEYSDGVGFSAPAVSSPITVVDRPLATVDADVVSAVVGYPISISANANYAVGSLNFAFTLASKPPESVTAAVDTSAYMGYFAADVPGVYIVEVVATDDLGASDPLPVTITATLPDPLP